MQNLLKAKVYFCSRNDNTKSVHVGSKFTKGFPFPWGTFVTNAMQNMRPKMYPKTSSNTRNFPNPWQCNISLHDTKMCLKPSQGLSHQHLLKPAIKPIMSHQWFVLRWCNTFNCAFEVLTLKWGQRKSGKDVEWNVNCTANNPQPTNTHKTSFNLSPQRTFSKKNSDRDNLSMVKAEFYSLSKS